MIVASEPVKVIRPHPFERESYGSMGTPAGHLGQFSVGNLLDQRMCEDVRHLRTVHILDHKSGRTKALHGLQEDLVGPLTYLPQDDVRHGSAADCDQVEDAALGCIQMLQASQYEISDIRGQGGHQIGTKRPALTTLMELISINEGTDERFDEQRRTTGAGAQEREQFAWGPAAQHTGCQFGDSLGLKACEDLLRSLSSPAQRGHERAQATGSVDLFSPVHAQHKHRLVG